MSSPRIVGEVRVAKGTAQKGSPKGKVSRTQTQRPSDVPSSIQDQKSTPQQRALPRYASRRQILRRAALPNSGGIEERVMAYSAAWFILSCTLPLYIPQLFFFVFGLAGIGLEAIPYLDWVMPGIEVFFVGWMMTVFIGVGSMLFAAFTFTMRGIDAFGGSKSFIFICCLIAYLSLFFSVIPWVAIWTLFVAYNYQDHGEEE